MQFEIMRVSNMRGLVVLIFALLSSFVLGNCAQGSVSLGGFTVVSSAPANAIFSSVAAQGPANAQYTDASWPVAVNMTFLGSSPGSIVVNFPDRSWVTLTQTRSEQRSNSFLWTGKGGDCIAFIRNAAVGFKTQIGCHNANYEVSLAPSGAGMQLVRAVAPPGETQNDTTGMPPGGLSAAALASAPAYSPKTLTSDSVIDVLVLYSEGVRAALDPSGGNAHTKQLARDAVDQTQQVMDNSVPSGPPLAQLNLVAAQEVAYVDDGNFTNDLSYLTNIAEPIQIRNFWAADVVMYLVTGGGTGISGLSHEPDYQSLPAPGPSYAPYASAALQYNCALMVVGSGPSCLDYYVFPHEFAHNFGANHNIYNSPWPSGPPYPTTPPKPVQTNAFGHYANLLGGDHDGYRTIMSYYVASACNGVCPRVAYYSNASVTTLDGFVTGVSGQENASVIGASTPATALYRTSLGRIFYNGFEWGQ